jgi:hypothetical protein
MKTLVGMAVGVGLLLAACASGDKKTDDLYIAPTNYKTEIVQLLTTELDDPIAIRDAFVTDPARAENGKGPYFVCVRFNARDINRKYKGSEDRIAYFYSGQLNQLVLAPSELCAKAAYKPFPELEKICMASKCV